MDPNAALATIRRLIDLYAKDAVLDQDDASALVEAVEGLDGWLSKGGFLPEAWSRAGE